MNFNNVFPNMSVLASYNPMSQIIEYSDLEREQFDEAISEPFNSKNVENAALIIHETSHFIDHVSTLNGQNLMLKIFNAYNGVLNRDEHQYFNVVTLQKAIRKLKFEQYYKEMGNSVTITSKGNIDWSYQTSLGARFDSEGRVDYNRPVIFSNYKYRSEFIGRIPLSLEALWETNAVASELHLHMGAIGFIKEKDEALVTARLLDDKYTKWVYTPELLTYSCATELVSSHLGFGDMHTAFMVSKSLASIALNLPFSYYKRMRIPISIGFPKERINGFKNSEDPSCIYYLMIMNIKEAMAKGETILKEAVFVDTEKVLSINGLPSKSVLENEIKREMTMLRRKAITGPSRDSFLFFNKMGLELFEKIGIDSALSTIAYIKYAKNIPTLCGLECLEEENQWVQRHDEVKSLEVQINNIVSACGY